MRFIRKIFGSIIVLMIFTAMTSFGNSHNVSAISGSQILAGTAYTTLDPFGVEQFFPQKAGKQQLVMGYDDPNSILGFGLDGGGKAISQTQGQFHYYTIPARSGQLSSGGTQLTMRINLNPVDSSGSQVNWMTAEKRGYMVVPNDIDEFEQTGYIRIPSATQDDDITLKQGGQQTSLNPSFAGAFGIDVSYSGKYWKTAEKELNHTKYEFFNDSVALQTGSIVGKWIGVKEISKHTTKGQFYDVFLDLDPIDFTTGLPKNHWKHLSSNLDNGKEIGIYSGHITSWGKKYFTYRIDNAPNIDFALLSVHHIDTTPVPIMNDTVSSAGMSTYSGRQIQAEYASVSSALVGKNMNSILVKLKKVGSPTGTVQIGIFNNDLSTKKLFGTIDASTVSTSYTQYTFALSSSQTYLIQSGDRIGIKFTGGDSSTNYIAIMTDRTNTFDGTNSYRTQYTTSWSNVQTEDLTMTLK